MIVDLNSFAENPQEFDICIIGGGVAGITAALELNNSSLKVALLEGGSDEYSADSQMLYKGENIGKDYYTSDTSRIRFLGGTSNHWGGNCRELQPIDFEEREWIPFSGWPIDKRDLSSFYTKAAKYCQIGGRSEFKPKHEEFEGAVPKRTSESELYMTQYSPKTPDTQSFKALSFGAAYKDALAASNNISLFLNANVLRLKESKTTSKIESVTVANYRNIQFNITANRFVLATGGLENARLLLVSNEKNSAGVGNSHDCVGRYFMEHLSITLGHMIPSKENLSYYDIYDRPKRRINPSLRDAYRKKAYITFSESLLRERRMGNTSVSVKRLHLPLSHKTDSYKSARELIGSVLEGDLPIDFNFHLRNVLTGIDEVVDGLYWKYFEAGKPIPLYRISVQTEQVPNPNSRVLLTSDKDRFGVPKLALDWQLNELDLRTIRETALLTARELGATHEGRLVITMPEDDDALAKSIYGDWHHMGTTRMSKDPSLGVVDANCKVHECENLYIAGSSVFSTGGHSVPTLTISALAARLANHLKESVHE